MANQPSPINNPGTRVEPRRNMDLYSALRSALRMWLVARDSVIWLLVQGESAQSGGAILSAINPAQFTADSALPLERMNVLREMAYDLAALISASSAESVLRAELEALLRDEQPKFVLSVDGIPGAF